MTKNQIAYLNALTEKGYKEGSLAETERSNRANEAETNRANVARETETNRHNVVTEVETNRSNVAKESEASKHNRVTESLDAAKVAISRDSLNETIRHNQEGEQLSQAQLAENIRHNQKGESQKQAELNHELQQYLLSEKKEDRQYLEYELDVDLAAWKKEIESAQLANDTRRIDSLISEIDSKIKLNNANKKLATAKTVSESITAASKALETLKSFAKTAKDVYSAVDLISDFSYLLP